MLISNETQDSAPAFTLTETGSVDLPQRFATLERELQSSRSREQAATTALREVRRELADAQARIAQQQDKIRLLAATARTQRPAPKTSTAPLAPSLASADLIEPQHPYHQHLAKTSLPTQAPATRLPMENTPGAARLAALWQKRPEWARGAITLEDATFFDAVLERVRPSQVHEIGVASGTSSALILNTLATQQNPAPIWLHSYDLFPKCYFDQSRAVGDATREMVPDLLGRWKLKTGVTALDVLPDSSTQGRPLYFIDANHIHPWPGLDLIALLPGLRPGDCLVLHDINLPEKFAGQFLEYGAQWLFEDWLGPRLEPDVAIPNIGAIFMPDDFRLVLPSLVKYFSRPWTLSHPVERPHLRRCEQRLAQFLASHDPL